jgi:ATP-dependent Lon protease
MHIIDVVQCYSNDTLNIVSKNITNDIIAEFNSYANMNTLILNNTEIKNDIQKINTNIKNITDYMTDIRSTLDKAVYGHTKAKKQIERIIAQWINGDINSNTAHVLGFEGNPGIGKTTLAKGLADCLKDEHGTSRPFSLIALGGDSNASTLVGHSYTYVGSNYGSIVQILIDKKCMNPIILFDEVDKISKTENGKEITGILPHLLEQEVNSLEQILKILFRLYNNDNNNNNNLKYSQVEVEEFSNPLIERISVLILNRYLDIEEELGNSNINQIQSNNLDEKSNDLLYLKLQHDSYKVSILLIF